MLLASTAEVVSGTVVAVAGIVGGAVIAWMSLRAQRKQQVADHAHDLDVLDRQQASAEQRELRNEMLNAAAALAGDLTSAYKRVNLLSEHQASEALDEIQRTLDNAAMHLGRVSLLFGPKTEATQKAESAYQNVRDLLQLKRSIVDKRTEVDDVGASKSYEQIDEWAGNDLADFKRFAYVAAQKLTGDDVTPTQVGG